MMAIVSIIASVNVKDLQQIVLVLFKMEISHVDVAFGTMRQEYKKLDEAKTIDDEIEIPVQVNGKLKATVMIALDEDEASVKEKVHKAISDKLDGKNIVKEIYVKNKIYNVVVKQGYFVLQF